MRPVHEHRRHGKVPLLEAFIVIGTAAMLAAAVAVWQQTENRTQQQRSENRQRIEEIRKTPGT